MTAGELVSKICKAHNYPKKTWGLFEVIADGNAERPLHHSEHVLSVIKAWEMPSTNYLLAKHDYARDQVRWVNPKVICVFNRCYSNQSILQLFYASHSVCKVGD